MGPHDPQANCETDTDAGKRFATVEALEHAEYLLYVFGLDPDSIVGDRFISLSSVLECQVKGFREELIQSSSSRIRVQRPICSSRRPVKVSYAR
jgi:hypothetical protein